MFSGFMAKSFTVALLLFLCSSRISGFSVGFSHEANERSSIMWPPIEVHGFHERSMLLKILLSKPISFLEYVPTVGIFIDLLVDQCRAKEFMESIFLANSWTQKALPHMNINSIIVRSKFESPTLILSTLQSIQSSLKIIDLDRNIKVSPLFSLPILENFAKKDLQRIINFVNQSRSFITVEVLADSDLTLEDGFIYHVIQRAFIACSLIPNSNISIVLNLESFLPGPDGDSVAELIDKISISVEINPKIKDRIHGFFVQVPSFKSFHRELLGTENRPIFSAKLAIHDTYATNPTMTPITVSSTTPSPIPVIITVPATNPASILPTIPSIDPMQTPITIPSTNPLPITNPANPTNAPITIPATNPIPDPVTNPANPVNAPITVPSTNPMQTPVTNPATNPTLSPPMPVTNPVTTPTTNPADQPVTTPSTTYPGTLPVSPTGFGQAWCVAKSGLPDSALQLALDYACGMGGADCSAIQEMRSCYNPNTLQAHASYAFNSYYQRNPVPSSCDFGGTSMIVTVNPSTVTCIYPTASPPSNYNPATGLNPAAGLNPASGYNPPYSASSGSASGGSSVLNPNSAGGSSSGADFASDDSNGSVSSGSTLFLVGWVLPIFLLASTCNFW